MAEGVEAKGNVTFYCVLALLKTAKPLQRDITARRRSFGIKKSPEGVFHDRRFGRAGRQHHVFELAMHSVREADIDTRLHCSEFRKEVAVRPIHAKGAVGWHERIQSRIIKVAALILWVRLVFLRRQLSFWRFEPGVWLSCGPPSSEPGGGSGAVGTGAACTLAFTPFQSSLRFAGRGGRDGGGRIGDVKFRSLKWRSFFAFKGRAPETMRSSSSDGSCITSPGVRNGRWVS